MKLWQKQNHSPSVQAERFTVGNDYQLDQQLIPYDVKASKVHARALLKAGLLTPVETEELCEGLDRILKLWEKDAFPILPEQEDGHTAIEAWLTEHTGEAGKKIHTGRSRNDQVLTALRMYEKDHLEVVMNGVKRLADTLLTFAEAHEGIPMPGFTHTRKAMLSGVSQWAAGYAELLILQLEPAKAVMKLVSRSPLGTAAGFGSAIDLDRDETASGCGFDGPLVCAASAQLSRGWMEGQLVRTLADVTALTSRMAADIIRFSSETHGYMILDDAVCTGSSIMPQKRNPDVAELVRGKHAVVSAQAYLLQQLVQNLESGYHRDLQLTKEPVFTAFGETEAILGVSVLLIESISISRPKLEAACTPELFAAEYANLLVRRDGLSFREAYRKVAENPALVEGITSGDMMAAYRQLGSPGNTGIQRLRSQLEGHLPAPT